MRDRRTFLRCLALLGTVGLVGTCRTEGEPSAPPEAAPIDEPAALRGWHYDVTLDGSLERADVHLCFAGRAPARLIPGLRDADPHGYDFRTADGEPLPRSGLGHGLEGLGEDGCVDYWVDLDGLERSGAGGRMVGRTGQSLMIRPSLWMWRPDVLPDGVEATLRLSLPPGVRASVPWPTEGGASRDEPGATYRLGRTAFDWLAYVVFGALTI
ncbi:MAG: hypothetical protein KDK70_43410, partial [Myxococcales bacterium]|nr:hypothetical protein [Myxococcales bacterium]